MAACAASTVLIASIQAQGALVLFVGVLGWTLAGLARRRELARERAGRPTAAARLRAGRQAPPVCVVLPVRGCRPHSRENWESQLHSRYDGPLRFVFVADSASDPAVPVVTELLRGQRRLERKAEAHGKEEEEAQQGAEEAAACGERARQAQPFSTPPPQRQRYSLRPRKTPQAGPGSGAGQRHAHVAGGSSNGAGGTTQAVEPETGAGGGWGLGDDALVIAGPATTCSQKIHNLLAGVRAALEPAAEPREGSAPPTGPAYVLFLDDDVALHPGTVGRLVDELEGDAAAFMATGYPFDLVGPGAPLAAYAALAYHLPLSIAFTISRRAPFVWGGCMLLRADELRTDRRGVLKAWAEGGYSDDMLLAATCTRLGLPVATHRAALLPQLLVGGGGGAGLAQGIGWPWYWNYLRRQLFVLDTYHDQPCRRLNHGMMAVHSWASAAVAISLLSAAVQLACSLAPIVAGAAEALAAASHHWVAAWAPQAASWWPGVFQPAVAQVAAAAAATTTTTTTTTTRAAAATGAAAAAAARGCLLPGTKAADGSWTAAALCGCGLASWWQAAALWTFVAAALLAQCSLAWMARQSLHLMAALSEDHGRSGDGGGGGGSNSTCSSTRLPQANSSGKASSGSGGRGGSAAILRQAAPLSWPRVWAGILIESLALPFCVACTLLTDTIEWAGIRYRKRHGRVEVVAVGRGGGSTKAC